jgi:hypothetical protein
MANRQKGEVNLVVDGRTFTLVLDIDAMCALEEHFSTPSHDATWDEIAAKVNKGSVRVVRALIWAMLQRHHPDLSVLDAGHLMNDAGGIVGLARVLKVAMESATPDPEDIKALGAGKANPQQAQAGKKSKHAASGVSSILTHADVA